MKLFDLLKDSRYLIVLDEVKFSTDSKTGKGWSKISQQCLKFFTKLKIKTNIIACIVPDGTIYYSYVEKNIKSLNWITFCLNLKKRLMIDYPLQWKLYVW